MNSKKIFFSNTYLRNYLFNFLRKKPKVSCFFCKRVLVWDKKVYNYIKGPYPFFSYENNKKLETYCINCWSDRLSICQIS